MTNKWSKNLDDRPHRRGRIFHGGKYNATPTMQSGALQSRCHAVTED